MSQVSLSFPDQTYTSTNKPSVETLKSDLSDLETGHNATDASLTNFLAGQSWTESPQGYMLNGKIVPSVSSDNLTVAIKTLSGTDPSATDPVYVRIGDTVRSITSALSVTKNAGTNWCNAGSSELATKEIDYFVYLGYNATDGVVIGFSRYPGANSYDDFSTTTTNEKYCAISTITNASATDYYEVIGRFVAILSAGAGYTWSVPTFTAKNLIQRPIYETRRLSISPQYSASGSMTYTSVSTDEATYKIMGTKCFISYRASGTTGGTASAQLNATLPFTTKSGVNLGYGISVRDITAISGWATIATGTKIVSCAKYDNSDFGLGASRNILPSIDYEI
jgi:hypothetical protein